MSITLIIIFIVSDIIAFVVGTFFKGYINKKSENIASKHYEEEKNLHEIRVSFYKDLVKIFDDISIEESRIYSEYISKLFAYMVTEQPKNLKSEKNRKRFRKRVLKYVRVCTKEYNNMVDSKIPHNILNTLSSTDVKRLTLDYINCLKISDNDIDYLILLLKNIKYEKIDPNIKSPIYKKSDINKMITDFNLLERDIIYHPTNEKYETAMKDVLKIENLKIVDNNVVNEISILFDTNDKNTLEKYNKLINQIKKEILHFNNK